MPENLSAAEIALEGELRPLVVEEFFRTSLLPIDDPQSPTFRIIQRCQSKLKELGVVRIEMVLQKVLESEAPTGGNVHKQLLTGTVRGMLKRELKGE